MRYFHEYFLAADLPAEDVVLGMHWFEMANPEVH